MTGDDDKVLQMLAGATFGPNAKVILPSGTALGPAEAQAFTAFYATESADRSREPRQRRTTQPARDNSPLSSRHDRWAGDQATDRATLVARARAARYRDIQRVRAERARRRPTDRTIGNIAITAAIVTVIVAVIASIALT